MPNKYLTKTEVELIERYRKVPKEPPETKPKKEIPKRVPEEKEMTIRKISMPKEEYQLTPEDIKALTNETEIPRMKPMDIPRATIDKSLWWAPAPKTGLVIFRPERKHNPMPEIPMAKIPVFKPIFVGRKRFE